MLELTLPENADDRSQPISDIAFTNRAGGRMMVAEHAMEGEKTVTTHSSRVFEYARDPGTGAWLPSGFSWEVGTGAGGTTNSAGGIDYYDPSSCAMDGCDDQEPHVFLTAVPIASPYGTFPDFIDMYGLIVSDVNGDTTESSWWFDIDDNPDGTGDKPLVGDVEVYDRCGADVTGPVFEECTAEAELECGDPAPPVRTAEDECGPDPSVSVEYDPPGMTTPPVGCNESWQRTWTATDCSGNASQCVESFTIKDTTPPALAGVPVDVTVECDAVPAPATPTASDACDSSPAITFQETRVDGTCPDAYVLTRTWTATDTCENAATGTQTITVQDTTPPTLAGVPVDVTVDCDGVPAPATPTAADDCDPAPSITFLETRVDGECPDAYVLTRTWTATDRCGNVAMAAQTIQVVDTMPPEVTGGSDDLHCLWPPNHRYVCFSKDDFTPEVTDDCDETPDWRFDGCASDQCDDAPCPEAPGENGDGSTGDDCLVTDDWICVRAERAGTDPEGRRYAVSVVAVDQCGNESGPVVIGSIYVPHDQRPHEKGCVNAARHGCASPELPPSPPGSAPCD